MVCHFLMLQKRKGFVNLWLDLCFKGVTLIRKCLLFSEIVHQNMFCHYLLYQNLFISAIWLYVYLSNKISYIPVDFSLISVTRTSSVLWQYHSLMMHCGVDISCEGISRHETHLHNQTVIGSLRLNKITRWNILNYHL